MSSSSFPFSGEYFAAPERKFQEIIFVVPFYQAKKTQLKRHIDFVNSIGFDAFIFELEGDHKDLLKGKLPLTSDLKFGAKHRYSEQIEVLLNMLPGEKIVYAFSNPCASAFEAMARRKCSDVTAMVCDSGPTAKFIPSAWALYTHEFKIKFIPLKILLTPILSLGWSPLLHKDIQNDLNQFPKDFPLLSIRGWKDKLIPPAHIDEVFEPHSQLQWQKLSLPEAGHLNGLKDFRAEYEPGVSAFLLKNGTKINL
jgi:predicted alpha/beta hydrolase